MWFLEMFVIYMMSLVAMVTGQVITRCPCFIGCCGELCGQGIEPREPYFLEGEDIVLTCNRNKGRASRLTFLVGAGLQEVSESYIKVLNSTAIQLTIPNISREDVGRTVDTVLYRCVHKKNHSRCFDNVYVKLEYNVHEPVNLECRDFNFKTLKCGWSLGVAKYHHPNAVNIRCSISNTTNITSDLHFNNGGVYWESCPDLEDTECYWDHRSYPAPVPSFTVKVEVRNEERNITRTIEKTFDKYDIVEPEKVTELSYRLEGRCMFVKWKAPKKSHHSFLYEVTYHTECAENKRRRTNFSNATICNLVPNVAYNISVRARLVTKIKKNGGFQERGFWSKPASTGAVTNKDVVDVNPVTLPGLYEVRKTTKLPNETQHTVRLYFTPLNDCDLHDSVEHVHYTVRIDNMTSTVKHPAYTTNIDITKPENVHITVQASNSVGQSNGTRRMTVFQGTTGLRPSGLVMQLNQTNNDCVVIADVSVKENGSDFTNISHTLVWCEGLHGHCQKPVQWKEFEEMTFTYTFPDNQCDTNYRYGLVTYGYSKSQGQFIDSGIQWENCLYQLGKVPDKQLSILTEPHIEDNTLNVAWKPYDCKDINAYIINYQVTYCSGHEDGTCKCDGKENVYNISQERENFTSEVSVTDSSICVSVKAFSRDGSGPVYSRVVTVPKSDNTKVIVIVTVGSVALLGVVVFLCCYCCRRYCNKIKSKTYITLPPGDKINLVIDKTDSGSNKELNVDTSGIDTEFSHSGELNGRHDSTSEQSLLDHDNMEMIDSVHSELPGYKSPGSFNEYTVTDAAYYTDLEDEVEPQSRLLGDSETHLNVITDNDHKITDHSQETIELQQVISVPHDEPKLMKQTSIDQTNTAHSSQELFKDSSQLSSKQTNKSSTCIESPEISILNLCSDVSESYPGYNGFSSGGTFFNSSDEHHEREDNIADQKADCFYHKEVEKNADDNNVEEIVHETDTHVEEQLLIDEQSMGIGGNLDISNSSIQAFEEDLDSEIPGYKNADDISSISTSSRSVSSTEGNINAEENDGIRNNNELGSNRDSASESSSNGNSDVPHYIIKTDSETFAATQPDLKHEISKLARINGVQQTVKCSPIEC